MLFSRFIFVSTALFAGSAAAFSVQPSTSVPKTALYASSSDNEGVIERRQVLASLAATAAASLGASSAFALDVKADASTVGDAINFPNPFAGANENKGLGMGKTMEGNPAEKVKSDVRAAANNLNPFSGGGDNKAQDLGRRGQDIANKASSAARGPLEGNQNAVEAVKSIVDSSPNPFSKQNDIGGSNQNASETLNQGQTSTSQAKNPLNSGANPLNQSNFSMDKSANPVPRDTGSFAFKNGQASLDEVPNPGDAVNKAKDAIGNLGANPFKSS